jgi:hypothetical protein
MGRLTRKFVRRETNLVSSTVRGVREAGAAGLFLLLSWLCCELIYHLKRQ